jgi:hypothetical protein
MNEFSFDIHVRVARVYINKIRKEKGIVNALELHKYIANKLLCSICLRIISSLL